MAKNDSETIFLNKHYSSPRAIVVERIIQFSKYYTADKSNTAYLRVLKN